ncbi:phosphatase PAP2 family protein [Lentibacillus populi]|uniref:Phosphatase PAP2 family protein n=1 Tax=Lentibacillus populi TaxID=1827502 RepID=A0A9W5U078_9BACI|nr:phosphatase PAP2 family protein [Lentibacillus populi]
MKIKELTAYPFILTGIVFLLLFGVISWGVYVDSSWVHTFDLTWIDHFQSYVSNGKTSFIMKITELGNIRLVIALTIILVIVLFFKRKYAEGLWLGGTILVCAAIAVKLLKHLVDRDRPEYLQLITKTNESFPSGHATATTIFYGLIGLLLFLAVKKGWTKFIIAFITLAWILFIMVTRIYLGVHYPTDVLAGFLFGMASVFISVGVYLIARDPLRNLLGKLKLKDKSELLERMRG